MADKYDPSKNPPPVYVPAVSGQEPETHNREVWDLEHVRDHLETYASQIANLGGVMGGKIANEYLAKLQHENLTPEQLVKATGEFTKDFSSLRIHDPNLRVLDKDDAKLVAHNLDEMRSETADFASRYHVDTKAPASPSTSAAPPASNVGRSKSPAGPN